MRKSPWFWPFIILLSAIAAGIVSLTMPGTVLCLVVILWFLLTCPGMMVVRFLNLKETAAIWTLTLALSLAIDAIVASIALYAGTWSPAGILYFLISICIIGVNGQFIIARLGPIALPELPGRKHLRASSLLLPLFVIVLSMSPGASSFSVNPRAEAINTTASSSTPASQATPFDVVIVMDNVNYIISYDAQGDRFKAAQLLVNLMPSSGEIGIVGITSTPNPRNVLALQTLQTSNDKALVNNTLSENTFGPVDPAPTAYFTPALQMAGSMLLARTTSHRKLILIFTDVLAFSGDQNACNISPDAFHNWFCAIQVLEQEGISVALVGFTSPGSTSTFQPVQQFFETYGGFALSITSTSDFIPQLTLVYQNLLRPVRPVSFKLS